MAPGNTVIVTIRIRIFIITISSRALQKYGHYLIAVKIVSFFEEIGPPIEACLDQASASAAAPVGSVLRKTPFRIDPSVPCRCLVAPCRVGKLGNIWSNRDCRWK